MLLEHYIDNLRWNQETATKMALPAVESKKKKMTMKVKMILIVCSLLNTKSSEVLAD